MVLRLTKAPCTFTCPYLNVFQKISSAQVAIHWLTKRSCLARAFLERTARDLVGLLGFLLHNPPVEIEHMGEVWRARLHRLVHLVECAEHDLRLFSRVPCGGTEDLDHSLFLPFTTCERLGETDD